MRILKFSKITVKSSINFKDVSTISPMIRFEINSCVISFTFGRGAEIYHFKDKDYIVGYSKLFE